MSSDSNQTFMTGGGEGITAPITKLTDSTDPSLALTRPHLSPTRLSTARQTILGAVETLEEENEELRRVNNRMLAEMEHLRAENDQLRKDLDTALQDKEEALEKMDSMSEDNRALEEKLRIQTQHFADENRKFYAIETSLKQENDKYRKQTENMKEEFTRKENDIRSLTRDLDFMKSSLEKASRKNFHDKDVEVFHEMEMLKGERKDLIYERDEVQKLNKKYSNEIKKLETNLDQKASELRNENRRHALLTKEFNSLLEENNHLKLQLRRRRQGTNNNGGQVSAKEDTMTETIVTEIDKNTAQNKRYGSTSQPGMNRELSFADSSTFVPKLPQRSALLSRDRLRSRERSGPKSDISTQGSVSLSTARESEQDFIIDRHGDRRLISKKKSPGSRSDSDTSPPPELLPNISGGRTWRP